MKHVQACLSAEEHREISFTTVDALSGSYKPVYMRERLDNAVFNPQGGALKHVQACLSARDDRESSFYHCGCPVRLVQACLCTGKT